MKTSKMLIMNGEKDVTNGKCFDGEVKVGDKLSLKIIPNLESSMYGDVGIYLNNAGIIQFNTNHNEAFPKIDSNLNQVIDQKYKFEKGYNLLFGEKSFSFVVKPFKNNTIKVTLINGEETSCTFNVSSESINNS